MKNILHILIILSFLLSCKGNKVDYVSKQGDTIHFKYAENIEMVKYPDYTIVRLKNPWNEGSYLHTYILTQKGQKQTPYLEGTNISFPLQKSIVFNTAHASLLGMLESTKQIKGVCDLKYMNLPEIHHLVSQDEITDCGNSMSPDIERIIDLKADAILLSPFENSGGYGRLEEIGIPIIECADYMETSALGRAEWMKFYGLLYGCEQKADSLFAEVEKAYHQLMKQAQQSTTHRSIVTERMTGSTWYIAGGKSSVGRLIADAKGIYAWASDTHSGSLALPFEAVLDKAGDADVWIFNDSGTSPMTYQRLSSEFHGYTSMKAFQRKQVYVVNSMTVPYFEQVSFRPDWLLRDYIILLHPDLKLGNLKYFKPL
ncbi:MAG: ABC transporter substrate-binding protein [Prevotella sp.]|nr:ABC transporter substrate-binding protein [Prevotella sp.]